MSGSSRTPEMRTNLAANSSNVRRSRNTRLWHVTRHVNGVRPPLLLRLYRFAPNSTEEQGDYTHRIRVIVVAAAAASPAELVSRIRRLMPCAAIH